MVYTHPNMQFPATGDGPQEAGDARCSSLFPRSICSLHNIGSGGSKTNTKVGASYYKITFLMFHLLQGAGGWGEENFLALQLTDSHGLHWV